jgi:hypothetical protein
MISSTNATRSRRTGKPSSVRGGNSAEPYLSIGATTVNNSNTRTAYRYRHKEDEIEREILRARAQGARITVVAKTPNPHGDYNFLLLIEDPQPNA